MNSLTFSKQTRTYQDGEPTGEWSIIDESGRVVGHITSRFTDNVHGMMGKWTAHWTVESYEVNITDAALRARIVGSEPWMDRMLKDGETAVTVLAEVKRWVRTRVFAPAAAPAPAAEPATNSFIITNEERREQDGEPTGEWMILDGSGAQVGQITSWFKKQENGGWTVRSYLAEITNVSVVGERHLSRKVNDGESAAAILAEIKRWVRTRVLPAPAAAPAPAAEIIWTADGDVTIGSRPDGAEVGIIGSPRINAEGVGFRAVTTAGKDSLVRDFRTLDEARAWIATFA